MSYSLNIFVQAFTNSGINQDIFINKNVAKRIKLLNDTSKFQKETCLPET